MPSSKPAAPADRPFPWKPVAAGATLLALGAGLWAVLRRPAVAPPQVGPGHAAPTPLGHRGSGDEIALPDFLLYYEETDTLAQGRPHAAETVMLINESTKTPGRWFVRASDVSGWADVPPGLLGPLT